LEREGRSEEVGQPEQRGAAALAGVAVPVAAVAGGSSSPPQAQGALARIDPGSLPAAGLLAPGQQGAVAFSGPALVFDPPELPARISPRAEAVSAFVSALGGHAWGAVHGGASTGKTLLVRLTCVRLGGKVLWVNFKGLTDDAA